MNIVDYIILKNCIVVVEFRYVYDWRKNISFDKINKCVNVV